MNIQKSVAVLESVIAFESIVAVKEAWQTLKTFALTQQTTNKQSTPLMLSDGKCIMCGAVMDSEAPIAGRDY